LLYARQIRPSSGGHSRSAAASALIWAATDPGPFRAWLETAPHSCLSSARRSTSPVLHIVLRYSSVIKKKIESLISRPNLYFMTADLSGINVGHLSNVNLRHLNCCSILNRSRIRNSGFAAFGKLSLRPDPGSLGDVSCILDPDLPY
jgi:hypothetical protein